MNTKIISIASALAEFLEPERAVFYFSQLKTDFFHYSLVINVAKENVVTKTETLGLRA